ncbi:MAG TPA: ABC transporter transmembrane domain-containing protein, partial [Ilumatobacteraceae bacterium]
MAETAPALTMPAQQPAAEKRRRRPSLLDAAVVVIRSLGADRRMVWILGAIALVGGFVDSAGLYIIARLATSLTAGSDGVALSIGPLRHVTISVTEALLISAGLVFVVTMLALPTAWLSAKLSEKALVKSQGRLIDAYLRSSWSFRSTHSEGHLQHLIGDFTPRIERLVLQLTVMMVNIAGILMAITAAVLSAPAASAYFIAGLGLVAAAFLPLTRRMPRLSRRYLDSNREVSRATAETARMAQEVEVFDVAPEIEAELAEKSRKSGSVLARFRFLLVLIPTSYQNAALAVVIAVIALIRMGGAAQLAAMGPVLMLLVRALIYARQLQYAVQTAVELTPYALGLEREIEEMLSHTKPDGTNWVGELGTIRFKDLAFAHKG